MDDAATLEMTGAVPASAVNVRSPESARFPPAPRACTTRRSSDPTARPLSATECEVTRLAFSVLVLPYAVVRPYSTCESLPSSVVHVIVAPDAVIEDAVTAEITGG